MNILTVTGNCVRKIEVIECFTYHYQRGVKMSLRQQKTKKTKPNYVELERIAELQGVKPFNFDEAIGEGSQLWKNGEFEEFEKWLKEVRVSDTANEKTK